MKLRLKLCGTSAPPLFLELYEDNLLSITVIFSNFKKITCRVPAISWCRSSDLFPLQQLFAKKLCSVQSPWSLNLLSIPTPLGFLGRSLEGNCWEVEVTCSSRGWIQTLHGQWKRWPYVGLPHLSERIMDRYFVCAEMDGVVGICQRVSGCVCLLLLSRTFIRCCPFVAKRLWKNIWRKFCIFYFICIWFSLIFFGNLLKFIPYSFNGYLRGRDLSSDMVAESDWGGSTFSFNYHVACVFSLQVDTPTQKLFCPNRV